LTKFNAAIHRAPVLGVVRRERRVRAVAIRLEPVGSHAILRAEQLHHRRRTAPGEIHVRGQTANIIGVAHHVGPEHRVLLQQLRHFLQRGRGRRFDLGLSGIEEDSVHHGMAGAGQTAR
jgi:hypothetical protein